MKKRLTKIVLAASLLSMPAIAGADDEYNSLFGIEGGYTNVDVEQTTNNIVSTIQKNGLANGGIKIGAESQNYRIFLSARYYDAKDFNKLDTVGAEFQYKFNFAKSANFFLGANAGKAYAKISQKVFGNVVLNSANINSGYVGADAGLNIHASKLIDLELGARYMRMNKTIVQYDSVNNTFRKYNFDSLATAYASIIFKWQMD